VSNLTRSQLIKSGLAFAKSGGITQATEKFGETSWKTFDLSYDWARELPFIATPPAPEGGRKPVGREFPETSIGWYRTILCLSAHDQASASSSNSTVSTATPPPSSTVTFSVPTSVDTIASRCHLVTDIEGEC